ncbi:hypothetical protein K443DRAFT_678456 [Laccaria amethystina LaAM-08-1]|uniref:HhH-GPD domain-containing protein n=1 Tax=Laccaria amethystina LaAM-08-1 TaxID=1095629 RepID=A0A0C9WRZ4_9AGAR|nr:hypothetical protein K443DRAFT_678456 [Laccaria amethystina LaAM-08-1]
MPVVTRSVVRSIGKAATSPQAPPSSKKRKANSTATLDSNKRPRHNGTSKKETPPPTNNTDAGPSSASIALNSLVPAVLSFDFELAKNHLVNVDRRFQDLFVKMQCKPFEHLEQLDPFRALSTSILGQQISWLAARSITHRFIRLYHPSIPEKPDHQMTKSYLNLFPTPQDIVDTDIATLRTAGLSARKAEYVKDLASRFVDGRLSTEKLLNADDDDLYSMLIEVRGIGRVCTVDMFAIFSLRRPDILPVGDLGVQRGLVRWFLSLHSPTHLFALSPEKVSSQGKSTEANLNLAASESDDALLEVVDAAYNSKAVEDVATGAKTPISKDEDVDLPSVPPPFTPSIHKTLNRSAIMEPVPLPEGITVAMLKSRLEGKKKIKGAFLTPQEMAALTECWKPFRSLGVYYMWSLAAAE